MKKVVVYVPLSHAQQVRAAIGEAGGGRIGNYSHVTFSSRGTGRFRPEEGAHPSIGSVGELQAVDEERIEFVCDGDTCKKVVDAIRAVHPYEEPAIDMWPIELV